MKAHFSLARIVKVLTLFLIDALNLASDGDDEKLNNSDYDEEEELHHSESENEEDSKSLRGPTITPRNNKGKTVLTYNRRGVPTGEGAKKLATFEGMVGRTMVPITYPCWLDVPDETKDGIWQYTLTHFEVDPKSRKQVMQSVGTKWRNFKYTLNKKFIKPYKNDPKIKFNPPRKYPFIKKQDWKLFVSQKTSKKAEVGGGKVVYSDADIDVVRED